MTKTPFKQSRIKVATIATISVIAVAAVAAGTIVFLKNNPFSGGANTAKTDSTSSPTQKAEELMAKGDLAGAKTQYESVLATYKAQKNETGVKDIEVQLQIIDATSKASKDPERNGSAKITSGGIAQ